IGGQDDHIVDDRVALVLNAQGFFFQRHIGGSEEILERRDFVRVVRHHHIIVKITAEVKRSPQRSRRCHDIPDGQASSIKRGWRMPSAASSLPRSFVKSRLRRASAAETSRAIRASAKPPKMRAKPTCPATTSRKPSSGALARSPASITRNWCMKATVPVAS